MALTRELATGDRIYWVLECFDDIWHGRRPATIKRTTPTRLFVQPLTKTLPVARIVLEEDKGSVHEGIWNWFADLADAERLRRASQAMHNANR
jgi:hypothetical protein